MRGGQLIAPVACPDGPGPCVGIVSAGGSKQRFSFEPGERETISLTAPEPGSRASVRLRSLLGPGVARAKKRRLLR